GDDDHVEYGAAGAAIAFRKRQRQQAGFSKGLEQLFGVSAFAVVLAHIFGRRVLLQKLTHALAQQPLFLGKAEIHDVSRHVTRASAAKYNPGGEATAYPRINRRSRGIPMTEPGQMFSDGKTYERMMGRWSKRVGVQFLDWLAAAKGLNWVEAG